LGGTPYRRWSQQQGSARFFVHSSIQGILRMKKIATLASAVALCTVSVSASAWWGAPYGVYGLTEDQQRAMAEQQTKAMEQMMAAQQQMAKQMAARRADVAERMQAQGVDPTDATAMGFPGTLDPWGDMGLGSAMGPWGDMCPWGSTMDPWADRGPWGEMSMPGYPAMPEMRDFDMMPGAEPFTPQMPQPPVPAFMKSRYSDLDAYRARIMEESSARREEAMRRMAERRKKITMHRHIPPYGYARSLMPHPGTAKATEMRAYAPQEATAAKVTAPAVEAPPAPVATAAPAVVAPGASTAPEPAATATPVPVAAPASAPEAAPVAPAPAAATPQS
jgi:hypothetical protein